MSLQSENILHKVLRTSIMLSLQTLTLKYKFNTTSLTQHIPKTNKIHICSRLQQRKILANDEATVLLALIHQWLLACVFNSVLLVCIEDKPDLRTIIPSVILVCLHQSGPAVQYVSLILFYCILFWQMVYPLVKQMLSVRRHVLRQKKARFLIILSLNKLFRWTWFGPKILHSNQNSCD